MMKRSFDHIIRMTNDVGMFEHAKLIKPRQEHGYCTDDMARLLIVAVREPSPIDAVRDRARLAMRFLLDAQDATGKIRNRRATTGHWRDKPGVDDSWGRSVWAFGTTVRHVRNDRIRQIALAHFELGARLRSPHRRSMAFAALGAAEVLSTNPEHALARHLIIDAAVAIGRPLNDPAWPWPERRLAYANAALPEALLAAGDNLGRDDLVRDGLVLLSWLLDRETVDGHLSPTPVGGAGREDVAPAFDQQPIEIAAMADACYRAAMTTGDMSWLSGVYLSAMWFAGRNDVGVPMWDSASGGAYDGLQPSGPNLNQGAESALALVSTLQRAHEIDWTKCEINLEPTWDPRDTGWAR